MTSFSTNNNWQWSCRMVSEFRFLNSNPATVVLTLVTGFFWGYLINYDSGINSCSKYPKPQTLLITKSPEPLGRAIYLSPVKQGMKQGILIAVTATVLPPANAVASTFRSPKAYTLNPISIFYSPTPRTRNPKPLFRFLIPQTRVQS